MIYLKLLPWVAIAILGAALFAVWTRLDTVKAERDQAQAQLTTRDANEKVITRYVDRIVKVPGPAVVRDRLVRGVCHSITLPSPGSPDAAARAHPDAGPADEAHRLAADLSACQRNKLKLEALQEVLRPQVRAD